MSIRQHAPKRLNNSPPARIALKGQLSGVRGPLMTTAGQLLDLHIVYIAFPVPVMQVLHTAGPRPVAADTADRRIYRTHRRSTQTVHSGTWRNAVATNQVLPRGRPIFTDDFPLHQLTQD